MPVRVYIPTRICVDVDALFDRQADIEEALAAAAGRALANSRDVVLAKRGGYIDVLASPPEIIWTGVGLGSVSLSRRAEIEECVAGVLSRAVKQAGICDRGQTAAPLSDRPGESFDGENYDPYANAYTIPSYDDPKHKADIPLVDSVSDPFAPPTRAQMKAWAALPKKPLAPLDYADLGKRLRSDDMQIRSNAAHEMGDHIREGDAQAFHLALWAMRTDNAAPTQLLLSFFSELAKKNPKKFKELLRAELAARPHELLTLSRSDINLPFQTASTARTEEVRQISDILAAVVRLTLTIPAAKEIFSELENHMQGLRRLVALIDALVEIRFKLLAYLRDERTLTIDDLFRHGFAGKAPPPPIDPTDPKTLQAIEHNTKSLPRVFGILASLAGEASAQSMLYDLQGDLIENYRWIAAAMDGIQQIDGLIMIYRQYYKESANKLDEVQVLQEARKLYLKKVVDNWLPRAALAINLTEEADKYFKDWFGLAADRKITKLQSARRQLDSVMTGQVQYVYDPYLEDSYNDSYNKVRDQLGDVFHEMVGLYSHDRNIEYLVLITKIEEKLSAISVYVMMLMYWHGVHQLSRYIGKENPGNSNERKKWMASLKEVRDDIKALYQKPDLYSLSYKPDGWKYKLDWVQSDIQIANGRDVFLTFVIVIVAIVVTAGLAAIALPEEVTLLVSLLFEAGVFTTTTAVLQATILDKPIDSANLAKSFAENFITFGALRILNAGIVAGARKIFAGRTLLQLGTIFGAQAVVNIGTALIVQRLETGEWPEDLETFIVAGLLMHTVVGLLSGPAMLEQLQKAALYDLYKVGQALNEEYGVWVKYMDKVYKRGGPSQYDFKLAQKHGQSIYTRAAEMLDNLSKLSDDMLAKIGLTRARVSELAEMMSSNAKIIENSVYDPTLSRRALPPPNEAVKSGIIPVGGNTMEFNPNTPDLSPGELAQRFRNIGYTVTEEGGVLHLLAPGETQPRYILLPVRSDIPVPALARLVGAPQSLAARGLRRLQQQNAVPALEAKLTVIAVSDEKTATALLRGIGRHVEATDVLAIQGIAHFLSTGGSPRALAVTMGSGNHYDTAATLATLRQFNALTTDEAKALNFIISEDVHGELGRGTDSIAGIGFHHNPAGPVYAAIGEIAPYAESGLGQFVAQLASENQVLRQEALAVAQEAHKMIEENYAPRLIFERKTVNGQQTLRVGDASVTPVKMLRSYTPAELDQIVARTPDIKDIRKLGKDMVQGSAGALFEKWARRYVLNPQGIRPESRLRVRQEDNAHIHLLAQKERSSDSFLSDDGSVWDMKYLRSAGQIDDDQLADYVAMQKAKFVVTPDNQRHTVNSINYLFADDASARANAGAAFGAGNVSVWYIDDAGVLTLLH